MSEGYYAVRKGAVVEGEVVYHSVRKGAFVKGAVVYLSELWFEDKECQKLASSKFDSSQADEAKLVEIVPKEKDAFSGLVVHAIFVVDSGAGKAKISMARLSSSVSSLGIWSNRAAECMMAEKPDEQGFVSYREGVVTQDEQVFLVQLVFSDAKCSVLMPTLHQNSNVQRGKAISFEQYWENEVLIAKASLEFEKIDVNDYDLISALPPADSKEAWGEDSRKRFLEELNGRLAP
jgi:hypothetical protein